MRDLPAALIDLDYCYLTTTGRVSGQPHEIEIWFVAEGSVLYLLSGGGDRADWVRNIRRHPGVAVRIGNLHLPGLAEIVTDDGERARAARVVFSKYQPRYDGDLSAWRDTALPVAVRLADEFVAGP